MRALLTIGEVARRTGIKDATLRAWERRYGFPRPARTESGYRLFDEDSLVDIAFFKRQLHDGRKAKQAADLTRQRRRLLDADVGEREMSRWRHALQRACEVFNEPMAWGIFDEAQARLGCASAMELLLFPALLRAGNAWRECSANVAHEHFVSQLAQRAALTSVPEKKLAANTPRILAGCAPRERHELGLLLLLCQLRLRRYRVIALGASVPIDSYLAALDASQSRVAIVSVTLAAHLREWSTQLNDVRKRAADGVTFIWAGPAARLTHHWPGISAETQEAALNAVLSLRNRRL